MKSISVIILCHNNRGISICIQAVLRQLSGADEIILVDDHSEPTFLKRELSLYLEHERVRFYSVSQKRGNRAYNRNFGAKQSKNDILLFLDGDMVPAPGTLQAFRTAHEMNGYVGFIGNAHGMRFAEEHMRLHLGREDYWELVQTEEGLQQLIQNPLLEEWRAQPFQQPQLEPFYWIYYFTCICSAQRSVFEQIGGFDEALVTWGSEDIDFGYCLSAHGKIGCASGAHAVHLPHKRNLWNEQLFDRDNTRYLLDKHRTWPFELLLSFDFSGDNYKMIQDMRQEIARWDLPRLTPAPIPNSLWVNVPSLRPAADTVTWYDSDSVKSSMELFGIALPCCDQYFETAYVSTHIFSYPMIMTSRILQECVRVSQRVLLLRAPESRRKFWDGAYMLQEREINRNYYLSSDTMEFEFLPLKDGSYQVLSPQVKDRLASSRSHCPIFLSAASRQIWHQRIRATVPRLILVNLLERDTEELQEKLEKALGILFEETYCFPIPHGKMVSLTEDIPLALRGSKSAILFLAPSPQSLTTASVVQWTRNRSGLDFLLDMGGTLHRLGVRHPIS